MRMLLRCVVALIVMVMSAPLAFAQPDLKEAERLIRTGKAEDAYNILQPYEFEQSGNVDYDYLLGLAALESGRPDQATLAFERVLARDPNFLGARLDMARAWYALNLFDMAEEELLNLQALDPPPAAKKTIRLYLDRIEAKLRGDAEATTFGGYLEVRGGHDTNVNASPDNASIYVPAFGGNVTLNASSVGTGDNYLKLAAGLNGSHRSSSGLHLAGGVEVADRYLQDLNTLNTTDLKGNLSVGKRWDRLDFTVGAQYNQMYLDRNSYRKLPSVGVDLRWLIDSQRVVFVFGQHIWQRYSLVANQPNDADISLAGAGYAFAFGDKGNTQCYISGYGGGDVAVYQRVDGNKQLYGAKAGLKHVFSDAFDSYINLGFQHGTFDKVNPLFQVTRRDDIYEASAGLIWSFAKSWSLRPAVSYFQSNSNIAIYDYTRTDYSVGVRYSF